MGLFNRLGRELEQFKRTAQEAADETAAYQCKACDGRFHTEFDECPECGAENVIALSDGQTRTQD